MSRFPAALTLFVLVSGCAGVTGDDSSGIARPLEDGDQLFILGTVIDQELLPVAGASVSINEEGIPATTSENGTFQIGPVLAGVHEVVVHKEGYAAVEKTIEVAFETVHTVVQLEAVALDVPYHETLVKAVFIACSLATAPYEFYCVPSGYLAGVNVTSDDSIYEFGIREAGLANVLFELVWQPTQPIGRELLLALVEKDQLPNCSSAGVVKCYAVLRGPSPLRVFLTPGEIGQGGFTPFDGSPGAAFDVFVMGSRSNSTIPEFAIFLEQHGTVFTTLFYNRPGPNDFTEIPDA